MRQFWVRAEWWRRVKSPQTATAPSAVAAAAEAQQQGALDAPGQKRYRVTIENLTTGQPFSPGVAVTHTQAASLFQVGSAASAGIRAIAEDGDPAVAAAALAGQPGIDQVIELASPTHRIGGPGPTTLTFEIARIVPLGERDDRAVEGARAALLARLRAEPVVNVGRWMRHELYED